MRVLQVSDGYPPATGGLERVVQLLARELVQRGHPTTVATLSRPDAPAREHEDGVDVRRLDGYTRHLRRFANDPNHFFHPTCPDPLLVRRLEDLVAEVRPDIVHAHGWILNSCLSLRLPTTTALVATLHDYGLVCAKKTMIPRERLDATCAGPRPSRCLGCATNFYGPIKGPALAIGVRHSLGRLDRVAMFMPISSAVRHASLDGVSSQRICQLPSFVPDDVFDPVPEDDDHRPDFLPTTPFVLFVGALGEHKGVTLLADAHRRMRIAAPLVMIGAVRSDTPDLTGTTERPIIVRTGVPHRDIMASYAAAAVAVAPSRWQEPLGLVPIEAMAAGTPVVVTRVGALPEVVAHHRTGLVVTPGDPAALAEALDSVVGDPLLRRIYGAAGRIRARRFAASAMVPKVIAGYQRARESVASSCPV
ncbi:glycosyl transferase [Mycolicibacterium madagascariense]|uniref:Glycosyl transferase n=1 Tax=Mycolicibacterium madagascariense TaxID=212765 RepID=A0A7I7XH54_9MYCO|nr:glycosyltransferase family 4 protein [Mycolicibacterium madagascariense]MCV7014370.1 glycosyltransferase family 4 protein [Mycolicibacterium madagascariense]BBZ28537.1 glycosyl transferase [Mycolicibacterium madagascariense]